MLFEKLIKKHLENCGWKEIVDNGELNIEFVTKDVLYGKNWLPSPNNIMDNEYFEDVALNVNKSNINVPSLLTALDEFNERKKKIGVSYGEYNRGGESFEITLSKVSHIIEKATYNPSSGDIVVKIKFLKTPQGEKAKENLAFTKRILSEHPNLDIKPQIVPRMVGTTTYIGCAQYDTTLKTEIKKIFTFDFRINTEPSIPFDNMVVDVASDDVDKEK